MAQTSVPSGTSSVKLLDANSNRKGLIIENSDANRLYVMLDSKAADTSSGYSFSIAQNETANPQSFGGYTGAIYGIWSVDGSGFALITEW